MAITSALDLEIALVPRKAMPVVKSIIRQTFNRAALKPPAIGKELQKLQNAIRALQIDAPAFPELDALRKAGASLQRLQIDARFLGLLRSARKAIERANVSEGWRDIADATNSVKALHNQIVSIGQTNQQPQANRPAYSLDDEEEDEDARSISTRGSPLWHSNRYGHPYRREGRAYRRATMSAGVSPIGRPRAGR